MKTQSPPVIDKVIYNFKGNNALQIDIVPIAGRLLTETNKGRTTAPHRTNFYRVIWFQKGKPYHTVDFEKIKIASPSLLFIHKDKIHKFDKDTLHDGKVLIFTDDFLFRTERDGNFSSSNRIFNATSPPLLISNVSDSITSLIDLIEIEIKDGNQELKGDLLYHLLNVFLYKSERAAANLYPSINENASNKLVGSFIELVERKFKTRSNIEEYATVLNVTTSKLNEKVFAVKGKTCKEIVTDRVILEAKRLLVHSTLSVKEIGFELGFKEPTNFIKFFHSNMHQTPIQFQKGYLLSNVETRIVECGEN